MRIAVCGIAVLLHGCAVSDQALIASMDNETLCERLQGFPGNGYIQAELDQRGVFNDVEWGLVQLRQVGVGMSELALLCARGRPGEINRLVTATGTTEQWMYGGRSVYVEDGKVTAFED